jgi:hypothetical protein
MAAPEAAAFDYFLKPVLTSLDRFFWTTQGGDVAVFDATNSNIERRKWIRCGRFDQFLTSI